MSDGAGGAALQADGEPTSTLAWPERAWRRLQREVRGIRHRMILEPLQDIRSGADGYRVTGPKPEFQLRSEHVALPSGWVTVSTRWYKHARPSALTLVADAAGSRSDSYLVPVSTRSTPLMMCLPHRVRRLRLRLPADLDDCALDSVEIVELGTTRMLSGLMRPYFGVVWREPGMASHFARRTIEVLFQHGARELRAVLTLRFSQSAERAYRTWVRRYDTLRPSDESAARRQLARLRLQPTFSIIAPIDTDRSEDLTRLVGSIRVQWYPHWELLLVERRVLPESRRVAIRSVVGADARIRWVDSGASVRADALNRALAHASGGFCGVVDGAAALAPHALFAMAAEHNQHPDAEMMYSDEDAIDMGGARHRPLFKPDWNPDLLCSQPYVGHFAAYRTELVRHLGGWRRDFDRLEEWDLALRATATIPATHIRHLPHVLYHADTQADGGLARPPATVRRMLGEHLRRIGVDAELNETSHGTLRIRYPTGNPPPLVSIIISTRNARDLLERCVTSLREKMVYPRFELVIVDNQSDDDGARAYLRALQLQSDVRVLRFDAPFNFSAINNFAVGHAQGAVLAFLNNDVEVVAADWLSEMVGHALRPEVGAVGAKLYYPDGRIQHAGVVLGLGKLAGHGYRGVIEPEPEPDARTFAVQDVSAVTAACMVLRTEVFRAVGGFDATLPVAYGDVDLCLRLQQRGYRVVWTPHAVLSHWESATRGLDHSVAKVRRLRREQRLMAERWGALLSADPAYNPNLTLAAPGFAPAFPPRVNKPWRSRA
ncbi:MAG TPA: glycosyltransferase family 2 protein [Candidatus Kryptonia bacterium]|nr:glycosyltransferase family 2 protein [Candidatus Kryptonia bacterium]